MNRRHGRPPHVVGRALIAALVAVLAAGVAPVGASSRLSADRITGTIHVNGCVLGPRDLTLRAQYLRSGLLTADDDVDSARPKPRNGVTAVLRATRDPHVLEFTIDELQAGELYHLAIRDKETADGVEFGECGELFWRGPFEGLAQAGGPPVLIEGFAARTQLEILRPFADEWQGSDHLDLSLQAWSLRSFRWRTSLPAVQAGELQISTEAFPVVGADGSSCAEPDDGIVYRQVVDTAESEWLQFPQVDLAAALAPPRDAPTDDRIVAAEAGAVTPMTTATYASLLAGAPIWVRVVPMRESGPACDPEEDGVHGWVNLAKIVSELLDELPDPPEPPSLTLGPQHRYDAPFFDPKGRPKGDQYSFVVTQPHQLPSKKQAFNIFNLTDPIGAMLVRDHTSLASTWMYPGNYIVIDPGEPSWWDDLTDSIGSLVTGAIDAIGFLVDKVSKAYAEIKQAAIAVALDVTLAIPIVKDACNAVGTENCRKAIEAGVDAGLASVGMPPSLPNWNELQHAGADYLAAEIASQAGVPQAVVDEAVDLGQDAMDRLSANRGGKGEAFKWLAPYYGFDPAVAYVSLHKEGGDLPPLLSLQIAESDLFLGQTVFLPTHWSGDLTVPIVLDPNVQDIAPPACVYPTITGPKEYPCSESQTARHFRNHYKTKLLATTCTKLTAMTAQYAFSGVAVPPIKKVPPPGDLQVSMFTILDEPTQNDTWSGKFYGVCT